MTLTETQPQTPARDFYLAGGTLSPDAPCYVERHADRARGGGAVRRREYRREFYGYVTLGVGYWVAGLGELEVEPYVERENPMGRISLAAPPRQRRSKKSKRSCRNECDRFHTHGVTRFTARR